jgi:hypothetical protein
MTLSAMQRPIHHQFKSIEMNLPRNPRKDTETAKIYKKRLVIPAQAGIQRQSIAH